MRSFKILGSIFTLILLSACGDDDPTSNTTTASQASTTTDTVNLSWVPPSARADGSYLSLSELSGYRLYMGTSTTNLAPLADLDGNSNTQYTVNDLPAGNYYFAVSALDIDGQESNYSAVIQVKVS
jgi:hypothetical protein